MNGSPAERARAAEAPTRVTGSLDVLDALDRPVYAVPDAAGLILTDQPGDRTIVASAPPLPIERFGARTFRERHHLRAAYVAGAMAGGIGSTRLVAALGRAGFLGGFGAGGLALSAIEDALVTLERELGRRSWKANLLHAPLRPELERATVELYLRRGVARISASGFMTLTPALLEYRAKGLSLAPDGRIEARTHVLAKVSRPEVARAFLEPAPEDLLRRLVAEGRITELEARLAAQVPVAEDVTVEGDSGGHTDRRASLPLLAAILELRDRIVEARGYERPIHVGSAGGVGTPSTVLAAFSAGADYVVTGSVNQACVEAGTSDLVKALLCRAEVSGVDLAPAADMFELGVKVQVLKQGTLFVPRGERLHRLYTSHGSWDEIPESERADVERTIFRRPVAEVWAETRDYLATHAPAALEEAERSPKKRLALLFRWYLAMGSRWATQGQADRKVDFQIWCGPIMGAFNRWVEGTWMAPPENRRVAEVATALLEGAARLHRARHLALQGVELPPAAFRSIPHRPREGGVL